MKAPAAADDPGAEMSLKPQTQLISWKWGAVTRYYLYDPLGSNPIWEYQVGLGWDVFNLYFNGRNVAANTTSGLFWRHLDHLGSLKDETNNVGQLTRHYLYLPFGETTTSPPASDKYLFTGKERDSESGLDYFGARYYGSSIGRFTSADSFTVTPARILNPQQLNGYAYVRNNPLSLVDPTGMVIDTSQLSEKAKQKWSRIEGLANKKDSKGSLLNPKLHAVLTRLKADNRTFVLKDSRLKPGVVGKFTIGQMSANDFTQATLQLDFKQIQGIRNTTPADLVPGFNKFEGILDRNDLKLAEVFGHEAAHGVFALDNTPDQVALQQLLNDRDAAMKGSSGYPYPPDVMQKIQDAERGLVPTETYAQQVEKIINGELQARENRQK